jgi:uncharacterized protein (DUF427 family)
MVPQVIPNPEEEPVTDYPEAIVPVDRVEPVPRRIRATLDGRVVVDTTGARYVWEWPFYPQYYLPLDDIAADVLVDEGREEHLRRGTAMRYGLRTRNGVRSGVAHHFVASDVEEITGRVRIDWAALDHWFEEDEEVFVHPRNPYTRVDALRSDREVLVELEGLVLARSSHPVLVFETGLPTRYYLDRLDVDFTHLVPSDTVTSCPYKGTTSAYWSVDAGGRTEPDLAWAYDFPTAPLQPVAGLVAFYNEKVDLTVDGVRLDRPTTTFS